MLSQTRAKHAPLAEPIWTTTPEESGLGVCGKSKVVLCQPGFMIRSVADFIDAVIELVDLRYRPEVNTIGALAESDSSEHAPSSNPYGPQRQRSPASDLLLNQI